MENLFPNLSWKKGTQEAFRSHAHSQNLRDKKSAVLLAASVMNNEAFVDRIGQLNATQIDYAQHVLMQLPTEIKQAAHDLIYCTRLDLFSGIGP